MAQGTSGKGAFADAEEEQALVRLVNGCAVHQWVHRKYEQMIPLQFDFEFFSVDALDVVPVIYKIAT